jgi:tRNA(fMet)-specific endonuclease VapC
MEILFILDTNTVSYYIAGNPASVRKNMEIVGRQSTAVSSVTEAELRYGVARRPASIQRRASVESFLANARILSWDSATAQTYADQERKGRPLSVEDLMIAAHALSLGLTVVTHDQAFGFVDGLRTADWTTQEQPYDAS